MTNESPPDVLVAFETQLGWMALVGRGSVVRQLTFGHSSREAAVDALDVELAANAQEGVWNLPLCQRLADYAQGREVDFADVPIDEAGLSPFVRRVLSSCRAIAYGQTRSYGQLAAAAGSPAAARAVGNCMAANRFPLIVPCHRVVGADGRLGAFSAPGGIVMKKRLLSMERASAGCVAR